MVGSAFPSHGERPYVVGNFVTTLDGVVSLNVPGQSGGGPISGFNQHDRMVMGLLRAAADAVIARRRNGAGGGLRSTSGAPTISIRRSPMPTTSCARRLQKSAPPLNVVVTAQRRPRPGPVPLSLGRGAVANSDHCRRREAPASARSRAFRRRLGSKSRRCRSAFRARRCWTRLTTPAKASSVLVEAGPRLMSDFFAEHLLDELFLTLAPQVAATARLNGRDSSAGNCSPPEHPVWGRLVGLKRGGDHLLLR